jgi:hypothetical protein
MDILELPKFKDAELGMCTTWHGKELVERIVYSGLRMVKILVEQDGMPAEVAAEYIEREFVFNFAGDTQPIILWETDEFDT